MGAVASFVQNVGDVVTDAVSTVGDAVQDVGNFVIEEVAKPIAETVEKTVEAAMEDPIGTAVKVAAYSTGNPLLIAQIPLLHWLMVPTWIRLWSLAPKDILLGRLLKMLESMLGQKLRNSLAQTILLLQVRQPMRPLMFPLLSLLAKTQPWLCLAVASPPRQQK